MLVYTPDVSAPVGVTDEFEFEFCAGGGYTDCHLVKLVVTIEDVDAPSNNLCIGTECVWTGDTNTDGVVDIRDVLPIGLCMGDIGVPRPNPSMDWYGQHSLDWNSIFGGPDFDVKHVDTDGDGIIESIDTTAISEHYGLHLSLIHI